MTIEVLLADDHTMLRDGVYALLDAHPDIRVVAAVGNGSDAVREALRLAPKVVIMDISMPVMSGIEATLALAKKAPEIRVLILSMHASPEMVQQALRAGARGYVTKQSAVEELIKAVRAVAAGKRYVSQRLAEALRRSHQGSGPGPSPVDRLTSTEHHILRLVAEGNTNSEVAAILGLSPRTVETYRQRLMRKLEIEDLPSLVKFAIRHGIVSLD